MKMCPVFIPCLFFIFYFLYGGTCQVAGKKKRLQNWLKIRKLLLKAQTRRQTMSTRKISNWLNEQLNEWLNECVTKWLTEWIALVESESHVSYFTAGLHCELWMQLQLLECHFLWCQRLLQLHLPLCDVHYMLQRCNVAWGMRQQTVGTW